MPAERVVKRLSKRQEVMMPEWRWVLTADPASLLPMVESPEFFHIIVVGAKPGTGRSIIMQGFLPAIRKIED
jgi:hypothetical protein